MSTLATATVLGFSILGASRLSVELGISVAIIEITLGVVAGNFFGVTTTPWIDFLASFGGILLTFLAGAEVDPRLMREKLKESLLIGGLSFLLPFIGVGLFAYCVAGWDLRPAEIAGVALSTTSLAVVYAVLVETGLTNAEIGKIIMAATFVTDLGIAVARIFKEHPEEQRRFRVVAFSLLTPFFFFKGGLNVSLAALAASLPVLIGFFVAKVALKFLGVLPVALRYVRPHAAYTTLLMS